MNRLLPILSLFLFLLPGCGGDGKMNVTGRITKGGAPYTAEEDDFLKVVVVPYTEPGVQPKTSYIADANNADGTFKVLGPDLRGLPPGKYRVALTHEKGRGKKDLLKGAYDLPKSPFVFDITPSTTEIVLDLDKKS